jgi:hypothetical protein
MTPPKTQTDGQPRVFLSGWTLNSSMWAHQMQFLSDEGSRCIAYDRRAHGNSSDPGRGYEFDTLADDLDCVIETLDFGAVTLKAHSFASGEVVRYECGPHGLYFTHQKILNKDIQWFVRHVAEDGARTAPAQGAFDSINQLP